MELSKVEEVFQQLKKYDDNFILAGSTRRKKPEPGDLDVVYAGDEIPNPPDEFQFDSGQKESQMWYKDVGGERLQIDIRRSDKDRVGAALLFLTGSQQFNIRCRIEAKKWGMKLSRKGLFDRDNDRLIVAETEEDILAQLAIGWIDPEDRN